MKKLNEKRPLGRASKDFYVRGILHDWLYTLIPPGQNVNDDKVKRATGKLWNGHYITIPNGTAQENIDELISMIDNYRGHSKMKAELGNNKNKIIVHFE